MAKEDDVAPLTGREVSPAVPSYHWNEVAPLAVTLNVAAPLPLVMLALTGCAVIDGGEQTVIVAVTVSADAVVLFGPQPR